MNELIVTASPSTPPAAIPLKRAQPKQLPRSVTVFTSPKAGSGIGREEVPRLVQLLQEAEVEVELTPRVDRLRERLRDRPERHVVVAAGGDGTISLAAAQLANPQYADPSFPQAPSRESDPVALIPMPLGTENLLARHFGLSANADEILRVMGDGQTVKIDLGIANGKPFLAMATCGFDAEVIRALHLRRRGHIRKSVYLGYIMRAMRHYRFPELKVTIHADQGMPRETFTCGWAMVFNLPVYAAKLPIEPKAIGDDGQLDLIMFRGRSVASGLRYLAGVMSGRHCGFRDVIRRRVRSVSISSDQRAPCQADGDYLGKLPLDISVGTKQLTLLVPTKADSLGPGSPRE